MSFQNVTVPYCELHGSDVKDIGADQSTIERLVLIDYDDAPVFCEQILGYVEGTGQTQRYIQPNRHPKYPMLWAQRCHVEGIGACSRDQLGIISYPKARVNIQYGHGDPEQGSGGDERNIVYITESRVYTYEYLTIDEDDGFYFMKFPYQYIDFLQFNGIVPLRGGIIPPGSNPFGHTIRGRKTQVPAHRFGVNDIDFTDPVPGDKRVHITQPKAEITITVNWWYDYPENDIGIMGLVGCVNADWYKPLLCEYPPHSLLLAGVNRNRQFSVRRQQEVNTFSGTVEAWQIEFKFLFNKFGWNTMYRAATSKADPGTVQEGGPNQGLMVNRNWPAGWYMIATVSPDGENMIFPYTPAPFRNFLLPQGFRPRSEGATHPISLIGNIGI